MIAVTGAAGFIGSNLARRLAAQGAELLLVDHPLVEDKRANLVGLERYELLTHDAFLERLRLSGEAAVGNGLRLETIYHLGACSRTTETDWSYLAANNVEYTQTLWRWCAEQDCTLIYASSAATYGDGAQGFSDRTPPAQLTPLNLYGKSKNDFDIWALEEVRQGRPVPKHWAGLKFFNVYGQHEQHKHGMHSVVLHAFRQAIAAGEVRLFRSNDSAYADGGQLRDFVYVEDCVDHMLWLAGERKRTSSGFSGLYNSGTGEARTFADLARAVFLALDREPNIRFIDMPATLSAQYQNYTQADMRKLREAGYAKPATTLEAGVRRYVEWLQARLPEARA
ncbi:MAG: ADP-glyceromanno-heptose 6-epimerase [Planctomycetia bacterium]|nr:ADP-glyceromanno-heptose 6-epimerase [Planctomycetia bacterium]